MGNKIDAKDVELYLLKNTDFFLTRESIVSELNFKHSPGKAESLLERQVRKLRNEQKDLLDNLSVFLSNASDNEDLFSKSKALILKLVTAENEDKLIELMKGSKASKKESQLSENLLKNSSLMALAALHSDSSKLRLAAIEKITKSKLDNNSFEIILERLKLEKNPRIIASIRC